MIEPLLTVLIPSERGWDSDGIDNDPCMYRIAVLIPSERGGVATLQLTIDNYELRINHLSGNRLPAGKAGRPEYENRKTTTSNPLIQNSDHHFLHQAQPILQS